MATRSTESSDEALMRGVREGNTDNLGVLFERHHARVHALCYRLTRRADEADDLAQEAFLRVLRYSSSYRQEASFTTWLYRIAYNLCAEQWQQTRREESMPDEAERADRTGEPVQLSERHVLLDEAMHRLEPEQRAVLVLTRYHDLKYDDVARVLECTPAAARVRAHRALNDLKEIYRELERRHDLRTSPRGNRR